MELTGIGGRRSTERRPLCATRVSGQRRASAVQGVGRDLIGGLLNLCPVLGTLDEGFAVKLVASSVPAGRTANRADSVVTMRAPMGASLPGVRASFATIGSQTSSVTATTQSMRTGRGVFPDPVSMFGRPRACGPGVVAGAPCWECSAVAVVATMNEGY